VLCVEQPAVVQFSSVRYTLKTYVLRGSGVGLGEEVGLQPPSKLSTTDGGRDRHRMTT